MTQPAKRRYALLINTKSRRGADFFAQANARLSAEAAVELVAAIRLDDPAGGLDTAIRAALDARPDVLVLGSGDGTVSHVVDYLADGPVALALIPLGTTNNYARTLGLPLAPAAALEVAIAGRVVHTDLASADGDYFANVASIGLSTRIARAVTGPMKRRFGRLAYGLAGLQELVRHRAFTCVVTDGAGRTREFVTHQLVIANGSFHAGTRIDVAASPMSGRLVVFSMDDGSKLRLLSNFIRYNLRGAAALSGHEMMTAKKLTLVTRPARSLEIDGEPARRTPVTIECLPGRLRVVLPGRG